MSGPLEGTRIIEIRAMGPLPFAGMLLSDMGADIVRIDRPVRPMGPDGIVSEVEVLGRGRRSIVVDLKHPDGPETILSLVDQADALIEGFRPGVMERLGLGPDVCRGRNPRLVYGRMTGWGQEGPLAHAAGHDINYISLAGALEPIGRRGEAPVPPLNLVGDFGGGGMLMAFGVVCGLLRARATCQGQVIDAAMVDGAALLTTFVHEMSASGEWAPERGTNLIDTGAPYYEVYETSDAKYVSVGALEEEFHDVLMERIGAAIPRERASWPEARQQFEALFKSKTRDEWCDLL
jgi:alpha-methylacyl-CoA racemase